MLHAHSTEFNSFMGLERVLKILLSFKKGVTSGEFCLIANSILLCIVYCIKIYCITSWLTLTACHFVQGWGNICKLHQITLFYATDTNKLQRGLDKKTAAKMGSYGFKTNDSFERYLAWSEKVKEKLRFYLQVLRSTLSEKTVRQS